MNKKLSALFISILLISGLAGCASGDTDDATTGEEFDSEVTVHRDDYGVPHIYADTVDDLYKAYGYVMAQDRLFQLEMFKRANEGTASEIFGEDYLEHDEKIRRDGYSDEEIEKMLEEMEAFPRSVIENFAIGIDTYIQEAKENPDNKLTKEFNDYDMKPEGWSSVDVLRLYMASMTIFMDQEQELENAQIYEELVDLHGKEVAQAMFNDIVWLDDPEAPTSSDSDATSNQGTPFGQSNHSESVAKVATEIKKKREKFDQSSLALGVPLKIGSNAAIIGSSKSDTENPIMFGGPQVGFTAPGFIYEVGLHGPDIDIQGSAFIGYPFVMFGTTDHFSFTATAGFSDVVDIFEEKLNPDNPEEYKFNGEWKQFEKRVEEFSVKQDNGEIKTVTKEFYESVHGPVIFKDEENNRAYSKKWAFRGTEADSIAAYINMNWSKDLDNFQEAARNYTMTLNWFYADVEDNIAYFHAGQSPIRDERVDWRLPTPGTGEYEWDGFHDMEDNPYEINPDRGYVVNWNNKPAPNWNNNERTFFWGSDNRVQQFIDGVEKRDKLTVDDVNRVNYDASFVNLRTRMFKPFLLDVIEEANQEKHEDIYNTLAEWDNLNVDTNNDGQYDSSATVILDTWWNQFYNHVIADAFGSVEDDLRPIVDHNYGSGLLYRLIQKDEAPLQVEHDWLDGQSIEEIALVSLDDALNSLEKEYGPQIDDWKIDIETMTFGEESIVGVPHGFGDDEEIISMNRGSENHFVEMTDEGPLGINVTPPGNIGFISQDGERSEHYRDQIELFKNFEYKPMNFYEKDVEDNKVKTETINFNE